MANRPTDNWRAWMAETAREVAAGTLAPECAGVADLHPEPLLRATDAALEAFEEVDALRELSDEAVFGGLRGWFLHSTRSMGTASMAALASAQRSGSSCANTSTSP